MHKSHHPLGVTSERRHRAPDQTPRVAAATRQRQPVSGEQSWILRAISWLGSTILEGFRLYGQSVYPCVIDLPEDYRAQAAEAQRAAVTPEPTGVNPWLSPRRSSHDNDFRAYLVSASAHSRQNTQSWLHLAAVSPRGPTGGSKRSSCVGLDVANDRSLRDDRLDPHDTSPVPQRFDPVR